MPNFHQFIPLVSNIGLKLPANSSLTSAVKRKSKKATALALSSSVEVTGEPSHLINSGTRPPGTFNASHKAAKPAISISTPPEVEMFDPHGVPYRIGAYLTSCGRNDLLARTIESFERFNAYPILARVVIDDCGKLNDTFLGWKVVQTDFDPSLDREIRITQANVLGYTSIVEIMGEDIDFVFHCEDDWEFYRHGFIEFSIAVFGSPWGRDCGEDVRWHREHEGLRPSHIQCSNNTRWECAGQKQRWFEPCTMKEGVYKSRWFQVCKPWHRWNGINYNAGLITGEFARKLYTKYMVGDDHRIEHEVSRDAINDGWRILYLDQTYCHHIGEGKHVTAHKERKG